MPRIAEERGTRVKRRWPAVRFRTLRGRLVCISLGLIFLLQALTYFLVVEANRRHATRQIDANLEMAARVFVRLKQRRLIELSEQARLLSYDYGFKQAFGASRNDPATMRLAMKNWQHRVNASFFSLISLDGDVLFDSENSARDGTPFALPQLISKAENDPSGETGGIALRDGNLFAVVLAPLLAPEPEAWVCLGFRIDDGFASELGGLTKQEVSFLGLDGSPRILATTHSPEIAAQVKAALAKGTPPFGRTVRIDLGHVCYVSLLRPLESENAAAAVLLQRDLDAELAPFKTLESALLGVALVGLAISAGAAFRFADSIAKPVRRLTQDARRVAMGEYEAVNQSDAAQRIDEIGQLTNSFRTMTIGLAERDRVRDLLGKVASPAIAAELMRREVALGGEQRLVTVLFSDLRGFTTVSERLPAKALVSLLNEYFTRMSQIIDAHGGVVDKYIGDALMALFNAPVDLSGHAGRALDAALEMTAALDEMNGRGFAPITVELGIGIHTDLVVAGNMGSPARHNYTVIGDGVNIASRLQTLTRNAEFDARILVSDATLQQAGGGYRTRALGEVSIKGKDRRVAIHALLGRDSP
jgi:adenylate cyclase